MRLRILLHFAPCLLAASCGTAPSPHAPPAPLTLRPHAPDDQVRLEDRDGASVIHVRCPRGIGRLEISRTSDAWPRSITLVLDLGGLEGFTAGDGERTVSGFLGNPHPQVEVRDHGGKSSLVADTGDFAMPIRRTGDRRIEVDLPRVLLGSGSRMLTIEWVDAYR